MLQDERIKPDPSLEHWSSLCRESAMARCIEISHRMFYRQAHCWTEEKNKKKKLASQMKTVPSVDPAATCFSSEAIVALHHVFPTENPGERIVCLTLKFCTSTICSRWSFPQVNTHPASHTFSLIYMTCPLLMSTVRDISAYSNVC